MKKNCQVNEVSLMVLRISMSACTDDTPESVHLLKYWYVLVCLCLWGVLGTVEISIFGSTRTVFLRVSNPAGSLPDKKVGSPCQTQDCGCYGLHAISTALLHLETTQRFLHILFGLAWPWPETDDWKLEVFWFLRWVMSEYGRNF